MVHAFLAAHREPDLCGLQVRDIPSWQSGGYTYLNRERAADVRSLCP